MADPYLEKPKPSRSLPLFDLKRPRRAHTLPHPVPHAKSTGLSFAHHQERPDAYLPCYITATNSARQALQIRSFSGQRPLFCGSPELRSAPLNSMLTLADDVGSQPFPYIELDGISSYSFTVSINETARVRSLCSRP
jgi:hypothetical protein